MNSLGIATTSFGDSLVLLFVVLHNQYGVALSTQFSLLAVMAVLSAFVSAFLIPSKASVTHRLWTETDF